MILEPVFSEHEEILNHYIVLLEVEILLLVNNIAEVHLYLWDISVTLIRGKVLGLVSMDLKPLFYWAVDYFFHVIGDFLQDMGMLH